MKSKKKISIMTINGCNFGNRLQNYALQEILRKNDYIVETLVNASSKYDDKFILNMFFMHLYLFFLKLKSLKFRKRYKNFSKFNKQYICFSKYMVNNNHKSWNDKLINNYDYFVCGSDQIWNPSFLSNAKAHFLYYVPMKKKIAYSPSFGTSKIPSSREKEFKEYLNKFSKISVREDQGKRIIKELIGIDDVDVLIDPTMLLTSKEWDMISNKPKMFDEIKNKKYILNYFLGELSESRKKAIEKIARENNCHIINLLDVNDIFYNCGPSEFLYLEKNAFLICTDSFHSSVFAVLYDRPFVVFEREDNNISMNSRIDTLIDKFKLENRKYNGSEITKENLNHDYTESYKILEKERIKAIEFLDKSMNIDD